MGSHSGIFAYVPRGALPIRCAYRHSGGDDHRIPVVQSAAMDKTAGANTHNHTPLTIIDHERKLEHKRTASIFHRDADEIPSRGKFIYIARKKKLHNEAFLSPLRGIKIYL